MVCIISSGSLFWITSPVSTSWSLKNSKIIFSLDKILCYFELQPLGLFSVCCLVDFIMDEGKTVEPTSYVTFFEYVPARELSRDDETFE